MSKLTTALEVERELFKSKWEKPKENGGFVNEEHSERYANSGQEFEAIEDFLTASNLRILSVVQEMMEDMPNANMDEVQNEKVICVFDLSQALQEAIITNK